MGFILFIWLYQVLVAARGTFNLPCSVQSLVAAWELLIVACGI